MSSWERCLVCPRGRGSDNDLSAADPAAPRKERRLAGRVADLSAESDWVIIQSPLDDSLLETISRALGTTVLMIYMMDEIQLRFSYRRFDHGAALRALQYDDGNPRARGKWTRVAGEPEPWEAILFSAPLMNQYRQQAPDEVAEGCADDTIKAGFSIPQPCHASTIAEIARALQLPWDGNFGSRISG